MDISEVDGYPYVAVGIYESVCSDKPVWVAGNSFAKTNDGRTFIKKGKLGKLGRYLKKDYDEFLVAGTTLHELQFDGKKWFYKEVPAFIQKGEYRERVYY